MSFQRQTSMNHLNSKADFPRKQSSADLQSRLKSRKILGVGVTGDGLDIHRSKLSQLLGTNDDIVNISKLPVGLNRWLYSMAILTAFFSLWSLLWSSSYQQMILGNIQGCTVMYSVCLLCICLQFMGASESTNKSILLYNLIAAELLLFFHTAGALHNGFLAASLPFIVMLLANTCYFLATLTTMAKISAGISKLLKQPREDLNFNSGRSSPAETNGDLNKDNTVAADAEDGNTAEQGYVPLKTNEENVNTGNVNKTADEMEEPAPIKDSETKKMD